MRIFTFRLRISLNLILASGGFFFIFFPSISTQAAESVGFTITPPLVKIKMEPGSNWTSSVKVINNGTNTVEVYAEAMNYKSGENGGPEFLPNQDNNGEVSPYALSQWIKAEPGPYSIPPQQSLDIPFAIDLPENATPGGHYAAIMIGTKPLSNISGTGMKISSLLASLLMVQVQGEVNERGQIREFSTEKTIYTEPKVKLAMSFENTGNVEIQPQGEIKIYDWRGNNKNTIAINQKSDFGNVLPESYRKWDFDWSQEKSILTMGKYRADLILGYGSSARETVNQSVYFWLIYPKPILIALSVMIGAFLIIFFGLKLYIRRTIIKTTKEAGLIVPEKHKIKISVIPEEQDGREYHTTIKRRPAPPAPARYSRFFRYAWGAIILILMISVAIFYFLTMDERKEVIDYNQDNPAAAETADAVDEEKIAAPAAAGVGNVDAETADKEEDITAASAPESEQSAASSTETASGLVIMIADGSGRAGIGSAIEKKLNENGYTVAKISNAAIAEEQKNVIGYLPGQARNAETIGRLLFADGEYKLKEADSQTEDILIAIGKDYQP